MKHLLVKVWNLWPPFAAAGIRIDAVSKDMRRIDVSMKLKLYNRNLVGTHFGGSLYAMTDPFYMAILIEALGKDYVVWDKAATIRFKKPGRGRVRASFAVDERTIAAIAAEVAEKGRAEPHFAVVVTDEKGDVVAEVDKTLSVRKKKNK